MDSILLVFFLIDSAYLKAFKALEPEWYTIAFPFIWHPLKSMVTTGKEIEIIFKKNCQILNENLKEPYLRTFSTIIDTSA